MTTAITVTNVSVSVFGANSNRRYLFLQNVGSTNAVFCAFGSNNAATTTNGIEIVAGDYYELSSSMFTGSVAAGAAMMLSDVACITASGSTSLVALEN